jgi:hypothetical protein
MDKIKKMIRIAASTTMSLVVFFGILKFGIYLQVPYLMDAWGIVLVLACGIITYENAKIWNEKDPEIVNVN